MSENFLVLQSCRLFHDTFLVKLIRPISNCATHAGLFSRFLCANVFFSACRRKLIGLFSRSEYVYRERAKVSIRTYKRSLNIEYFEASIRKHVLRAISSGKCFLTLRSFFQVEKTIIISQVTSRNKRENFVIQYYITYKFIVVNIFRPTLLFIK